MATINGSKAGETLYGTNATDLIYDFGGDDIIYAAGDDVVDAGDGDDRLLMGFDAPLGGFSADGGLGYDILGIYIPGSGSYFSFSDLLANGASFQNIEKIVIQGTNFDDGEIHGSSYDEQINGGRGVDFLYGHGGNDVLLTYDGRSHLFGGAGDDFLSFRLSGPNVTFWADGGDGLDGLSIDFAEATTAQEFSIVDALANGAVATNIELIDIVGSLWDDRLIGSNHNNFINGHLGDDKIYGGDGNDKLNGGGGADELFGENGDDQLFITVSNSSELSFIVDGGPGNDELAIIFYSGDVSNFSLESALQSGAVKNVEIVRISGSRYDNILYSSDFGGKTYINGNIGTDQIYGSSGVDFLSGDAGDDQLYGYSNNDILDGGAGSDIMGGWSGDDTYWVDDARDAIIENADEGTDHVNASISFALREHSQYLETLTLTGGANINGSGNGRDNVITGNSGNNILNGAWGDDTLIGGAGNDTFRDDAGADRMIGGTGNDTYWIDNIGDSIVENAGEGTDHVNASISFSLRDHSQQFETLSLTGKDNITG